VQGRGQGLEGVLVSAPHAAVRLRVQHAGRRPAGTARPAPRGKANRIGRWCCGHSTSFYIVFLMDLPSTSTPKQDANTTILPSSETWSEANAPSHSWNKLGRVLFGRAGTWRSPPRLAPQSGRSDRWCARRCKPPLSRSCPPAEKLSPDAQETNFRRMPCTGQLT
jgi:hypothetical protein